MASDVPAPSASRSTETAAKNTTVPSLVELPWAFGEFASDTMFLTGNQIRMAFAIAAACGKEGGGRTPLRQR
jgi:hypothetical protein